MAYPKIIPTRLGPKTIEVVKHPTYDEIPTKLYKFRDWDNSYHKRILRDQQIYYSSPKDFNDPFDCGIKVAWHLLKTDPIMCKQYFHELTKLRMHNRSAQEQYEEAERLIAEGRYKNDDWIEACDDNAFQSLNMQYGVFSATAVVDNILMWAHYSNSHKGFCVGFDAPKLLNYVQGIGIPKIHYTKEYPEITPLDFSKNGIMAQLMSKAEFWDYEIEFRLIKSDLKDRAVPLPKEIITDVIFGCAMPNAHKQEIAEVVNITLPHVKLFQAQPKKRAFEMEILPL